jgi:hypothetical protein
MVEGIFKGALLFPIAMVILFFISLPVFYLLLHVDEQIHNKDYDNIITFVFALVAGLVLIIFF